MNIRSSDYMRWCSFDYPKKNNQKDCRCNDCEGTGFCPTCKGIKENPFCKGEKCPTCCISGNVEGLCPFRSKKMAIA